MSRISSPKSVPMRLNATHCFFRAHSPLISLCLCMLPPLPRGPLSFSPPYTFLPVCYILVQMLKVCTHTQMHTHTYTHTHTHIFFFRFFSITGYYKILGFPGGSSGKESTCNAGDLGSTPGLGRFPGEGNGNPLQYSCLGNPMDSGAWQATVHVVSKSWT